MPPSLFATLVAATSISQAQTPEVLRFTKGFINVYAILDSDGVVLIDAHYPGHEDWIFQHLQRAGISLDDVTLSILTHGHADHAGSGAALQAAGLTVAMGQGDVHLATQGTHGDLHATGFWGRRLKPGISPDYPAFTPDLIIDDRLDLRPYGVDGEAVIVGGHSKGSLIIRLSSGEVLSGDLIRSRMIGRHHPALHFFHEDPSQAHHNIVALLDDGATTLLPAHGSALSARRLRRWLDRQGVTAPGDALSEAP